MPRPTNNRKNQELTRLATARATEKKLKIGVQFLTQHETADTDRKVHLRSQMYHMTNKILTKKEVPDGIEIITIKIPTERSH